MHSKPRREGTLTLPSTCYGTPTPFTSLHSPAIPAASGHTCCHTYTPLLLARLPPDHRREVSRMLDSLQRLLDFHGCTNFQFSRADGLGRVGVAGFLTGLVFGVHLSIAGCCLTINGLVLSRLVSRRAGGREIAAPRVEEKGWPRDCLYAYVRRYLLVGVCVVQQC